MTVTIVTALSVLFCSGCAAPVTAVSVAPPSNFPRAVVAPPRLSEALTVLQSAYSAADWGAVRRQFVHTSDADSLIRRMQQWIHENVDHLLISPVYVKRVGTYNYIATIQFADDSRTVPEYRIYTIALRRSSRPILGRVAGLGGSWVSTRTAHFIVLHGPFQFEGSDRKYLRDLESQRTLVSAKFGVKLPPVAKVYVYPDESTMAQVSRGECGTVQGETGCTRPFLSPPTIQTLVRAIYHEPIHVYERAISPPQRGGTILIAPLFIGEGLAVALEDGSANPALSDYCSDLAYAPLDDCARAAIANVNPLSIISDKGFNHADAGYSYSLGGSFVKYLITHGGYHLFARFYYDLAAQPSDRTADYDVAARIAYHQPMTHLIRAWRSQLCHGGC